MFTIKVSRILKVDDKDIISVTGDDHTPIVCGFGNDGNLVTYSYPQMPKDATIEPDDLVVLEPFAPFPPNMAFIDFRIRKVIKSKTGKEILTPNHKTTQDIGKSYG